MNLQISACSSLDSWRSAVPSKDEACKVVVAIAHDLQDEELAEHCDMHHDMAFEGLEKN